MTTNGVAAPVSRARAATRAGLRPSAAKVVWSSDDESRADIE